MMSLISGLRRGLTAGLLACGLLMSLGTTASAQHGHHHGHRHGHHHHHRHNSRWHGGGGGHVNYRPNFYATGYPVYVGSYGNPYGYGPRIWNSPFDGSYTLPVYGYGFGY